MSVDHEHLIPIVDPLDPVEMSSGLAQIIDDLNQKAALDGVRLNPTSVFLTLYRVEDGFWLAIDADPIE